MSAEPAERHLHAVSDDPHSGPPHDLAAERIVLGSMMTAPGAVDTAMETLTGADFYRPVHATVFAAIVANHAAQEPVDPVAVVHSLERRGDLARIGGAGELLAMVEAVPTAAMVGWYANLVAAHAARRRLVAAGIRIVDFARDSGLELGDVVNRAQATLNEATSVRRRLEGVAWGELIGPLTDAIQAAGRGDTPKACSTGLTDLDRVLAGGLRPGQLVTVAGRPGMGKSVLVVDLARHVAFQRREPVVLFTLEMSRDEVGQRILSAETSVDLSVIQAGTDSAAAWDRIGKATGRTGDAPLIIEDSATIDLPELRSVARHYRQRYGRLGLVAVDYLQLLTAGRRYDNRVQEVSELSRGLKLLAKELGCPVVAAAQLNRASEMRSDKRPHLADLRESGSVEQDSDIVLLLHRPDYYDPNDRPGHIDLIVAKNRNGPTGTVEAAAQLWYARIVSLALEG